MEKNISNNTPKDLIRPIFRHKLVIVISFLLISPCIYIGLLFQTPIYEAKVLIHIKGVVQTESQTYENIGAFRIHNTQMSIVTSTPVMKRAVKTLGLEARPSTYEEKYCHPLKVPLIRLIAKFMEKKGDSLSPEMKQRYQLASAIMNLKENTKTILRPNTDLFEIVVSDYSPGEAIEIANVVSRSYIIYDLEQQLVELTMKYGDLHPTIQQLQDNILKMKNNLNGKEMSDMDALGTASVKIIEQASSNYQPIGKPKTMIFLGGIAIALFAGIAIAFLIDKIDNTFKSPQDFAQHLNVPVIGTVPKRIFFNKNKIGREKSSVLYESFMSDLADQMLIFMKVQKLRTLLFVSVNPDTANSTIPSNLGYYLSGIGANVLVMDANITNPIINKLLNIDEMPGLTDILNNKSRKIEESVFSKDTNLNIMPVGTVPHETTGLIDETGIKTIIKYCKNAYDVVLIDCTLANKMSEMTVLSSNVDGVVIIANEGKDNLQVTKSIINTLNKQKANIIGGILSNRTFPIPGWLYNRI